MKQTDYASKPRLRVTVCLLGVLLLAALAYLALGQGRPSPHSDRGECGDCHVRDPRQRRAGADNTLLVRDVDALCRSCHKTDKGLSHPSGVVAGRRLPGEFPLDWAGRMTCATCHYTHRTGRPDLTGYLVRAEAIGRALCQRCHPRSAGALGGKHAAVLDRSHLGDRGGRAARHALVDATSLQCLGCHDGAVASMGPVRVPGGLDVWQHGRIGLSHPIGVDYPPRRQTRTRYRPTSQLDGRIRLFDGKLGCCSCHEPFSNEKHGLVMSNQRSALCMECHLM